MIKIRAWNDFHHTGFYWLLYIARNKVSNPLNKLANADEEKGWV